MPLTQEQAIHVRTLGWNPEKTFSINITDVWISRDAQISIGLQLKTLCISYDLPYSILRENLVQDLYWHEESDQLGLMIRVRDSHVESMYMQLPSSHWGFREKATSQ